MAHAVSRVIVMSPANEQSSYDPAKGELGILLVVLLHRLTFSELMSTFLPFRLKLGEMSFPVIGRNQLLPRAFHRPTDSPVRN